MLTSFFGNSRPVNFVLLGGFILLGYLFRGIFNVEVPNSAISISSHIGLFVLSVLSMLLLDFVVTKNKLTKPNTFSVLFFTCFMVMLPVIFLHWKIILSNFFLLLAMRRVISLRKDTNSSKKILDASIWITVASLFYFWSVIFFIPLWMAVIKKPNTDYKQILTPFTGFFAVFIINTAYHLLVFDSIEWIFKWKESISLDFSVYNHVEILIPVTVIFAFYIWCGISEIIKLPSLSLKDRPSHSLMLYISFFTFLIALAAPEKTGAEMLFVLAPISIITTNYFENKGIGFVQKDAFEFWFKEILLWLVLVLAVVFVFY